MSFTHINPVPEPPAEHPSAFAHTFYKARSTDGVKSVARRVGAERRDFTPSSTAPHILRRWRTFRDLACSISFPLDGRSSDVETSRQERHRFLAYESAVVNINPVAFTLNQDTSCLVPVAGTRSSSATGAISPNGGRAKKVR